MLNLARYTSQQEVKLILQRCIHGEERLWAKKKKQNTNTTTLQFYDYLLEATLAIGDGIIAVNFQEGGVHSGGLALDERLVLALVLALVLVVNGEHDAHHVGHEKWSHIPANDESDKGVVERANADNQKHNQRCKEDRSHDECVPRNGLREGLCLSKKVT